MIELIKPLKLPKTSTYCIICDRPYTKPVCHTCMNKLKKTGLSSRQIKHKDMLIHMLPYQQILCKKIFKYNASIKHRVPIEERLGHNLSKESISYGIQTISSLLTKGHYGCPSLFATYRSVKSDNLDKRLYYYSLLWFLSKDTYPYESNSQFQASLINHIITYIRLYAVRTTGKPSGITNKAKSYYKLSCYRYIYNSVFESVKPSLIDLM